MSVTIVSADCRRKIHRAKFVGDIAFREYRKNRGFSFKFPSLEPAPKRGYIVSVSGAESVYSVDEFSADCITQYIAEFEPTDGGYLGGWEHDGKVYLDSSKHFEYLSTALVFATEGAQIAVWDCAKNTDIVIDSLRPPRRGGLQSWSIGDTYPICVSYRGISDTYSAAYVWVATTGQELQEFRYNPDDIADRKIASGLAHSYAQNIALAIS